MKQFPPSPAVANAPPELFERGHLWLHELVDGAPVRFQLQADGRLRFGDAVRTFDDDVPPAYAHVVRHVREEFDRAALREAVDEVDSVVFFGCAMHNRGIDYDWERTPSFLGVDIWSAAAGEFLLPDRTEKIYRQLGLEPVNTVRAELRAEAFHPESYTFPESAWYDGPCAGVLVRNKTGLRAVLQNPAIGESAERNGDRTAEDDEPTSEAFARTHATTARFERVARQLRAEGRPVTFDTLYERTVEILVRAEHDRLFAGKTTVDMRAFRSEVAALAQEHLSDSSRTE